MKDAMKIDSVDAHIVRNVKGYGSQCGRPGMLLIANQAPNTAACTHTKWMLPQKRATKDAVRSAKLGSATASCSSSFTVRTLRRLISLACWRVCASWVMRAESWPCAQPAVPDQHR